MKKLLLFLIVIFIFLPVAGQKKNSTKKGYLEIFTGINAFGPAEEMYNLMKEYHFDATTYNWFYGGNITHPFYDHEVAFSFQVSYSHQLGKKSKLGLLLSIADLNEVFGATIEGGYENYLVVKFSNVSIVPIYSYELARILEVQAGPALMFNSGKKTSLPENDESYNKISPGLLLGLNLKLWESRVIYGKLSTNYLLTTKSKMGPFTANNFGQQASIPESDIGFGHLNVGFVLGVHL